MQTKDSDYDIMGLFLPPIDYLLGLKKIDQIIFEKRKGDLVDGSVFNFTKWFKLMIDQNPNTLELLWHVPTQYVYTDSNIWPELFKNRDKFLSKKIKHSFGGYAFAQMNRLDKLNEKVNENPKRLEEFKKFGYSTKNASHMFRLLNMCFDALVDKEVSVMRPERQFLISVREGMYKYDEIVRMANDKFSKIEEAYMRSDLRNKIDFDFANKFQVDILRNYIENFELMRGM
jgi:predicted nucleotidyltransferase